MADWGKNCCSVCNSTYGIWGKNPTTNQTCPKCATARRYMETENHKITEAEETQRHAKTAVEETRRQARSIKEETVRINHAKTEEEQTKRMTHAKTKEEETACKKHATTEEEETKRINHAKTNEEETVRFEAEQETLRVQAQEQTKQQQAEYEVQLVNQQTQKIESFNALLENMARYPEDERKMMLAVLMNNLEVTKPSAKRENFYQDQQQIF